MTFRIGTATALMLATAACASSSHTMAEPTAPASAVPPAGASLTRGSAAGLPHRIGDQQTLDEIDTLVRDNFYDEQVLRVRAWREHVETARKELSATPADGDAILTRLVRSLATSHTDYIPASDPRHLQLLSIFEQTFEAPSTHCRDLAVLPPRPFQASGIDVLFREVDGSWFVAGVFRGGIGERAGLLVGDEVLLADGRPFEPVLSFDGRDSAVTLSVRRTRDGAPFNIAVTPRRSRPSDTWREALRQSARVIERGGERIGYVHVWSWAGDLAQEELETAIDRLNREKITRFILDIRDGWGGAAPAYVRVFDTNIPVLESRRRDGKTFGMNAQIRVPAVLLINRWSRSGKEAVAFAVKKHHLATLVGETTGGSVLPGSPYCLRNGAVLYLAVSELTVDGERLEGRGVAPDRPVAFDVRYAAGADPQLEEAVRFLSEPR